MKIKTLIKMLFLTILLDLVNCVFSPYQSTVSMLMVALLGFIGAIWIIGSDE